MAALRNLMGDFEEVGDVKDAEIVPTGEQKILEYEKRSDVWTWCWPL